MGLGSLEEVLCVGYAAEDCVEGVLCGFGACEDRIGEVQGCQRVREDVWVGEVEVGAKEGSLRDEGGEGADDALFHKAGAWDTAVA